MKVNTPVTIERTYNASVEKLWKAITDKDEMREWYFDLTEFKPEPGFIFQFTGQGKEGESYLHICEVKEAIPLQRLVYSWRYEGYDGNSLVSFELFAEGDKTRLLLMHECLETFPPHPAFAKENFAEGWNYIIGKSLKEYLEGK